MKKERKYSQKWEDNERKAVQEPVEPQRGHEVEIEKDSATDVDENGVDNERADDTALTLNVCLLWLLQTCDVLVQITLYLIFNIITYQLTETGVTSTTWA